MSTIRVTTAYKPILSPHIAQRPTVKIPKPPPDIPFFRNKDHTIPTKWGLYRPLIRATRLALRNDSAPSPEEIRVASSSSSSSSPPESSLEAVGYPALREHIRKEWRKHRVNTSQEAARQFLITQYDLLSTLHSTDPSTISSLIQVETILSASQARDIARVESLTNKPKPKTFLSGGYIYPTFYNPPLPRLKPQPVHLSMMIKSRLRARERRIEKSRTYKEWIMDMHHETRFDAAFDIVRDKDGGEPSWGFEIQKMLKGFEESFDRETRRSEMKFSEELVKKVEAAKERKKEWKKEKKREWLDNKKKEKEKALLQKIEDGEGRGGEEG